MRHISRRMFSNQAAELISNGFMNSFRDCIACSIASSCWDSSDTIALEHGLKCKACEFSAIVMNATLGHWITRNPSILNLHCNMIRVFRFNALDFRQGGTDVGNSNSIDGEFTEVGDANLPRANQVNCNVGERLRSFFTRSSVTIRHSGVLVVLADCAGVNKLLNTAVNAGEPKVVTNCGSEAISACMSQNTMIPDKRWVD